MHPLDCVRLKRTITWPGAPHRSVLLSGASIQRRSGGVTNRCFGKRHGTEGSSSARSRSRAVPCRACRADCHNSVHSPARPLAFLNFFKGQKTSSVEEGGCRGSAGARWFHDISDKGGESGIWLHVTLMVLGDLWSSL